MAALETGGLGGRTLIPAVRPAGQRLILNRKWKTMSTTAQPRGRSKRERLIDGAREIIYRRGVESTTLADVAAEADIPVGNIYYYFKTKDAIVDAVVDAHAADRDALLGRIESQPTPDARLKALVDELDGTRRRVSDYGCPIGTLSSELDKRTGTEAAPGSQNLLGSMVGWAEQQFRLLGRADARDLAIDFIAIYEGTTLLTHSMRDPEIMHRQSARLHRWIDEIAAAAIR